MATGAAGFSAAGNEVAMCRAKDWDSFNYTSESTQEGLLAELEHDTALLMSANLMDYSLLLGVHNQAVPTSSIGGVNVAEPGDTAAAVALQVDVPRYYMGVIDVLQAWDFSKRTERWAKILFKGRFARDVRNGMSAVEPLSYRERFLGGISHQLGLGGYTPAGTKSV